MLEALDKLPYLSKAFFNEKVCSLTIRKADKCSYLSHKNNGTLVLIGVINKTKKFMFHLVKYKQFSVFKLTIRS